MRKNSHQNGQIDWIKKEFSPLPEKPEGWVTVAEIVEQTGNSPKTVGDRLRNMVASGVLEVMECKINGKVSKCYRKK